MRGLVRACVVLAACGVRMAFALPSVAFPREGACLPPVTNAYVIGAVERNAGATLRINGITTSVYRTGAFLQMVPVVPGTNRITVAYGAERSVRTFRVEAPPKPGKEPKERTYGPWRNHRTLGLATNTVAKLPPRGRAPKDILIVVDPGHGGRDTGAISPHGWPEKEANLLQALVVARKLRARGYAVRMTRETDDFPELYDRPREACRLDADLFVSIHHNASAANRNPDLVRHVTTYASDTNGLALAQAIQRFLAPAVAPVRDAGAQLKSLAVCRNPLVPSCLVEVDFVNSPAAEEATWDMARREKVADAIVRGIEAWLGRRD